MNRIHASALAALVGLSVLVAACHRKEETPPPAPPPEVELSSQQLIAKAMTSLKLPAVPEAPLSPGATRQQREDYLLATEEARKCLEKLLTATAAPEPPERTLFSADKTDQILAVSRVLGVQMADAVDRGDSDAAKRTLFIGFRYADLVGQISVGDWVAGGAIADGLCQGIKSASKQLDAKTAAALRQAAEDLSAKAPEAGVPVLNTLNRVKSWAMTAGGAHDEITVEQAILEATANGSGRQLPAAGVAEALKARARDGKLAAAFRANEANFAFTKVEEFLNGARSGSTTALKSVPVDQHPLAALYLSVLRPDIEAAPKLADIREENLRLIALTVRIIEAGMPDSLAALGQDAISPVSGMRFAYKKAADGFELVRPRAAR